MALSLDLVNQCKQSLQNSVDDYNEQFLGKFIQTTREDSGIGGAYKKQVEEIAEAIEKRKSVANSRFDDIITSFNEIGKTVEGFVAADLTGKLQDKVDDSVGNVAEMEVIRERTTDAAPGL